MNPEHENLVNSLVKDGYLKTPEIIEAFKKIDRKNFTPKKYKNDAYVNAPLPIGFGQTISQPLTVAFLIELLGPKAGDKILDIGAGSGWVTALLASIVGKKGRVIGIERIPELKEMAERNVAKYNFLAPHRDEISGARIEKGVVKIVLADGSKGYKEEAFYDKVVSGAAAYGDIPDEWKKQLKINGKIVAPIENSIVVIDKIGKKEYAKKEYFGFSFVPLITHNS